MVSREHPENVSNVILHRGDREVFDAIDCECILHVGTLADHAA